MPAWGTAGFLHGVSWLQPRHPARSSATLCPGIDEESSASLLLEQACPLSPFSTCSQEATAVSAVSGCNFQVGFGCCGAHARNPQSSEGPGNNLSCLVTWTWVPQSLVLSRDAQQCQTCCQVFVPGLWSSVGCVGPSPSHQAVGSYGSLKLTVYFCCSR